jgi:signal transduction histidine kinase
VTDDDTDPAAARRAAERAARAREDVLAIVSHDMRGPLNAIGIALDGLRAPTLDDATRAKYVGTIARSLERAERLIRDLLLAQQIEFTGLQVEPRPLAVRALFDQVARDHEPVVTQAGSKLVIEIAPDVDRAMADRERVAQALANLITNAIRHARGTPTVELGAHRDDAGAVVLTVRDHGPGIAADALPHVFDRYWQGRGRRGGAGLGLAIVRGIARAHGGDAAVANATDGGARFSITLPAAPPRTQ